MRFAGLEPDTEYSFGSRARRPTAAAGRVPTLARPAGRLLATFATANDVHFGETECGASGSRHRGHRAILRVAPGAPPYPEMMNGAVIDEMRAFGPTRSW